jgi:pyruvate-ferredoxin/flavodoxin oxidoreductase
MRAKDDQALKAFLEAEAYDCPSIIIAYSHCIAHGIDMSNPLHQQKLAVDSGQWILYRYNPDLTGQGLNPLTLDSKAPKIPVTDYLNSETRFRMLTVSRPEVAKELFIRSQKDIEDRYKYYEFMASRKFGNEK